MALRSTGSCGARKCAILHLARISNEKRVQTHEQSAGPRASSKPRARPETQENNVVAPPSPRIAPVWALDTRGVIQVRFGQMGDSLYSFQDRLDRWGTGRDCSCILPVFCGTADDVIAYFRSRFGGYEVSKPSVCNGLVRCEIYRTRDDAESPSVDDEGLEPETDGSVRPDETSMP
jgi:hypothetical protein